MNGKAKKGFHGFTRNSTAFLRNLKTNNDKPWFEAHRHEYEKELLLYEDDKDDKEDKMMNRDLQRKLLSVLAVFFSWGFVVVNAAFAQGGLTKIAGNVYAYVDVKHASPANSFGSNAGIVVGKDGILVIDALISAKEAKKFIKDIRVVSNKPIKYVVNTHMHLDHTFGNCEFAKRGATVIAQEDGKKEMKGYAEAALKNAAAFGLTEKDLEGTAICYPALTFDRRMEIDLGSVTVELVHLGHSHTKGSVIVFVPDRKALFAGDILFTDYHPLLSDGDIGGWVKALDSLAAMDVNVLVPGHGPLSGKKDIEDMKNYLILFDAKAKELAAQSVDVGYIVAEMKKSLPQRSELGALIEANVQSKYLRK